MSLPKKQETNNPNSPPPPTESKPLRRDQSTEDPPSSPPPEATYERGPVEKGSWNLFAGVLGRPGSGKSQFAVRKALEYSKRPGCYIIAHDVGWRLPDKLHDGKITNLRRHESADDARHALRTNPAGVHCVPSESAGEVVSIAEDCSAASLAANNGERGYPSIVLIDEIVAAGGCDPNNLSPYMRQLITLRRHKNVGCIWTCQSARMVHNQLLTLATRLYIFRLTDKRDYDRLIEAGVTEDVVEKIRNLPKYEYVEVSFD